MKKIGHIITTCSLILLITVFSSTNIANAQQTETLFSDELSYGGFGGPLVKLGRVSGDTGIWVGGRGGWIINLDSFHSLSLGGGAYGLVSEHRSVEVTNMYAMNGYGGFELEYTYKPKNIVHISVSSLIGAGGIMLRNRDFENVNDDTDTYFVLEPGINLELNVTDFFRISTGVNYIFTRGINRFGFTDSDFSGFNGNITFKFGMFL